MADTNRGRKTPQRGSKRKETPFLHGDKVDQYGFAWGPTEVTRAFSDSRYGYGLSVATAHDSIMIYVSPRGHRIRVLREHRELK